MEKGLILKKGTIVDSTIIEAPSSTKNKKKERNPDTYQVKKGNTWHFGYKAHIGVDQDSGLVHSIEVTGANTYPPSPHIVQNSRELSVKGVQHRRFCGGLPLTGGTGCSISRRRGGGISSRAASFPMTGKGRGDWVEYMRMEMSRNVQSGNTTRRSIELRPGRGCGIRLEIKNAECPLQDTQIL